MTERVHQELLALPALQQLVSGRRVLVAAAYEE